MNWVILATSFNRMAEALEQTEQRRLELIGNVAHELRTPLSSIRSTLEALTDGVVAEAATFLSAQRETAAAAPGAGPGGAELGQAGQIPIHCQASALAALITAAVERLGPQFEDKGVSLTSAAGEDLPAVFVDPGRIMQVLLNLLGNALQYTPPGGAVVVRASRQHDHVLVAHHTTASASPGGDLPHVFERFYRVDKSLKGRRRQRHRPDHQQTPSNT